MKNVKRKATMLLALVSLIVAFVPVNFTPSSIGALAQQLADKYLHSEDGIFYGVHLHADFLINLMNPICTYWHDLWPYYCKHRYHLNSWKDNGDHMLSPSDQIDMIELETEKKSWWHVDDVTVTITVKPVDVPEPIPIYFEFMGGFPGYSSALLNPVCTIWHEVYPVFSKEYHLSDWSDNGDGMISPCDYIILTDLETETRAKYHVVNVATDIIVTRKPVCTQWHEIYPEFCEHDYHLSSWIDTNYDHMLSPCDIIDMTDKETGEVTWWHVRWVTITIVVTEKITPSPKPLYLELELPQEAMDLVMFNPVLTNPVCTYWHELWPVYCRYYHLSSWEDNGDGWLSPSDQIDMTDEAGNVHLYHVDDIAIDILITPIPKPVHDVAVIDVVPDLPTVVQGETNPIKVVVEDQGDYPETFDVMAYADKDLSVIGDEIIIGTETVSLNPGDIMPLTFNWDTTGVPPETYTIGAVADVVPGETETLDNTFIDGTVTILQYLYLHGEDGLFYSVRLHADPPMLIDLSKPICTYWHELWPYYCKHYYHLNSWEDNGDERLSPSDQIDMIERETGEKTWWHVDDVTVTLYLQREEQEEFIYIESELGWEGYDWVLKDPIETPWHEIWPVYCRYFDLTSWKDTNENGILDFCDWIDLTDEAGDVTWWHVEEVATDIIVTRKPVCTQWHEIYPHFEQQAIWAIQNGLPDYPNSPHVTAFAIPSGTILRQFVAPVHGNGRGIACDGSILYYTLYPDPGKIYKMSTTGTHLGTILLSDKSLQLGAITWNGTQLWGAAYDGTSRVFTINPATGLVTLQFTFAGWRQTPDSQYGVQGYMDGLEYDTASNTLWLSDDAGLTVYHVTLGGAVISWFSVDPSNTKGNTGIVIDGSNLWLAVYDPPNPDITYGTGIIQKTTTAGAAISSFNHDGKLYEDLAGVDTVTFRRKYHLSSWRDNGDHKLSPSDIIDLTDKRTVKVTWWHVAEVTITIVVTEKYIPEPEPLYLEFEIGDAPIEDALVSMTKPVCTTWHEIWPVFSRKYHLSSWKDNGDGWLSPSDQIDMTPINFPGDVTWYHVDDVMIDIWLEPVPQPCPPRVEWTHTFGPIDYFMTFCPSPAVANLDKDLDLEIVTGTDEWYGFQRWHCFDSTGVHQWTLPTQVDESRTSVAIGDIDLDGDLEIAGGTTSGWETQVFSDTGSFVWRYSQPNHYDWWHSSPAICDVNPYRKGLEVIAAEYFSGKVFAFSNTGAVLWTFQTNGMIDASPACADIDNDGVMEVVIGAAPPSGVPHYIYALNGITGALEWAHWIQQPSTCSNRAVHSSAALADIDNDGIVEVVFGANDGGIRCLRGTDGTLKWTYWTHGSVYSSPAIGDVDCDGTLEIVVGSNDNYVYCLSAMGGFPILEWRYLTGGDVVSSAALANRGGTGLAIYIGSMDSKLYVMDGTGNLIWSFHTGATNGISSSPAVADIDGDSKLEVMFTDWNAIPDNWKTTNIFWVLEDCTSKCPPYKIEWAMFRHDRCHTGKYTSGITGMSSVANEVSNTVEGSPKIIPVVHDVAIVFDWLSKTFITAGETVDVYVTVENQGTVVETTNVTVTYDGNFIGSAPVTLNPSENQTLTFPWDTTGVPKGTYSVTAEASVVLGETDTIDNTFSTMAIVKEPVHDIAVAYVKPAKKVVGQGFNLKIEITIINQGDFPETFGVTPSYDSMSIGLYQAVTLNPGEITTITFVCDTTGVAKGKYAIGAYIVTPISGETDLADNTCVDGSVKITIAGDINGDGKVDHDDLLLLASAYGSEVGDPRYIPEADINCSGKVDHKDLLILAANYGKIDC